MNTSRSRTVLKRAGVIALGTAFVGAGAWWYRGGVSPSVFDSEPAASDLVARSTISNTAPLATSTPATQDAGQVGGQAMRRYSDPSFHFSLLYPAALQVTEYKEEGGALTVAFQNPDADSTSSPQADRQFQIYVTPYSGKQVSPARFKQDEPSGVRLQPTDIVVGGARATMFFSTNTAMGDTREVWFIHGGNLYEVTTYKELDTWLGGIMQTWQFI